LTGAAAVSETPLDPAGGRVAGHETVLVVEDEAMVRAILVVSGYTDDAIVRQGFRSPAPRWRAASPARVLRFPPPNSTRRRHHRTVAPSHRPTCGNSARATKGMSMTMCALAVAFLILAPFNAPAQTNATAASTVGTWKADLAKTTADAGSAPKAITLTILKDSIELTSWRVEVVDAKGESMSYSWSGPLDGSLQPVKDPKGQVLSQESLTRDQQGALLRHGVASADGSSFDGRATLSADGNTITDVVTSKTKDGKTSRETMVYRRVITGK
jgi:hypothetical protein